jgi:CelD/BcsL family acetyltransferase involved in cellulose biosynthesis
LSGVHVDIFERFDHPAVVAAYERHGAGGDNPFVTRTYQRVWWEKLGRGRLMIAVTDSGVAPMYEDSGMLYFVGSGGSDYLDFVGAPSAEVIAAMLTACRAKMSEFVGVMLYHVPTWSKNVAAIRGAAEQMGLDLFEEGELPTPVMQVAGREEEARKATRKESLLRNENGFKKMGDLRVTQHRHAAEVLPQLPAFFDQHQRRWNATDTPSAFNDEKQKRFYEALVQAMGDGGMLRFTRVELDGRPLAFHLGFACGGRYIYYKPTMETDIDKRSPGQVMLRHVLLDAIEDAARVLDFGLGDEAYKLRFATSVEKVVNYGIYPKK